LPFWAQRRIPALYFAPLLSFRSAVKESAFFSACLSVVIPQLSDQTEHCVFLLHTLRRHNRTLMITDLSWKIAVGIAAASWTVLNYLRGRTFRRRLELKVSGEIFEKTGIHFLSVVTTAKNVGLSKVRVFQEGTWVRLVRFQSKEKTAALKLPEEILLGTAPIFTTHDWIEPGEEINDILFVQLPERVSEDIAVSLSLRVKSREWRWVTEADLEKAESFENPNPEFVRRLVWHAAAVVPYDSQAKSMGPVEAPTLQPGGQQ
jgi:hypothetical protein